MANIFQTTLSSAFSWMKMYEFRLRFHWNLFLSSELTIPALVQIMAWRRPGDKPLSEPMMVRFMTHICVTRPQWVNTRISYNVLSVSLKWDLFGIISLLYTVSYIIALWWWFCPCRVGGAVWNHTAWLFPLMPLPTLSLFYSYFLSGNKYRKTTLVKILGNFSFVSIYYHRN